MEKYIKIFDNYSNHYLSIAKNDFQKLHINRKIEHSKRVNKLSVEIANKLGLSDKEVLLINIASLFHDIGRLEQFYQFNTYIDKESCNHASLGIEILEREKILNDMPSEDKHIILKVIELHNYEKLPMDISKELYTYASIIRDADKIDWLYAMVNIIPKLSEKDQKVFYSNKENRNYISEKVVDAILRDETLSRVELETIDELRIAAIGWIKTGLKCDSSYEIIKRENLINKAYNLMSASKEKDIIFDYINNFVNEKISNRK